MRRVRAARPSDLPAEPFSYNAADMSTPSDENDLHELDRWRDSMDAALRKENGRLAVAGLFWLRQGENTFGPAETNDIVLPAPSPPRAGVFLLKEGRVHLNMLQPSALQVTGLATEDAALEPDASGEPTLVSCGPLTMIVIQRAQGLAIRLWDNRRLVRETFPGRVWFAADSTWRIEAVFRPHDPPRLIRIPDILGDSVDETSIGRVEFDRGGRRHRLEALPTESGGLWLIFGDRTNGRETYPSGRFLVCPPPEHGRTTVDFNRAYNPPCAFTEFATCPLPPRDNLLDLSVEAGERYRPLQGPPV